MRRSHTWPAAVLVAGIALAGCAGASPTATPTRVPTASPTLPPTASPTASALDLCTLAGEHGENELAAGDYRVSTTQPAILLALPTGYTGGCADGTVSLFGTDGIIVIVAPVAFVTSAGVNGAVEPTVDAVDQAVRAAAAEATAATDVEIGGRPGIEYVVTVDADGVGLRSPADRGWVFNDEETENGGITLLQLDGAVAGIIRHGDDPLAVGDDVLASIQFESN